MHYDITVLRAILRLSRHRRHVDEASISLRVEGEDADLRNALRRLEKRGLVARQAAQARLTMEGLAVAVASLPARRKATAARRAIRAA